ncbi:hypothetical protein KEX41_29505 (plasmid) [Burkholderia thailandensis]|uniref:hypothetical protein n=1 Tax=Burkholderia thailandensis TaxID=57975 RepID=UPI00192E1D89|nr:hypothetical protein [Burkholderia thailandensis]MBS2132320.1 hypothetical protein [Burkholderia thailandensis]QRA15128.1 hypothetical protein JMY07_29930 [Burkholderia thailandensis]
MKSRLHDVYAYRHVWCGMAMLIVGWSALLLGIFGVDAWRRPGAITLATVPALVAVYFLTSPLRSARNGVAAIGQLNRSGRAMLAFGMVLGLLAIAIQMGAPLLDRVIDESILAPICTALLVAGFGIVPWALIASPVIELLAIHVRPVEAGAVSAGREA